MKNSIGKRITAALLVSALLITTLGGFTTYSGLGTAYYESSMDIFDDAVYSEIISGHPSNGLQHAHYVEADTENGEIMPFVFNGEVRATYSVGDMVKYAEEQGYKVLAAINGDVYDTSSGTPKGLVIHEGNIVTSGYAPDRVIAFDEDGKADMLPAQLAFSLKGTIANTYETQVPVEQPEPQPEPDQTASDGAIDTATDGAIDGTTSEGAVTDPTQQPVQPAEPQYTTVTEVKEEEWESKIDFFNVPHGGANGLHLYNRHYSSSTKTSSNSVEVVIEVDGIQLKVNDSVKGIVKSVNPATTNTKLTDSTIVLSTVNGSATADKLSKLVVGSEIEISVEDPADCGLEDVKECVGIYYSLVENGRNVTASGAANPRTAVGIKRDGTVILFELDGRQASVSKGLSLLELADAMIDLGCETAVNLDGGGSSVLYARQPGKDATATRQSSPSGGSERKVSNAILLVYKDSGDGRIEHLNIYPELSFAMPGATVQLEQYASNAKYEKIAGYSDTGITYDVDSDYGTIDENGLFTAGDRAGRAEITANHGRYTGKTEIEIVKDIKITPSVSQITIDAGETRDIDVDASVGDYGAVVKVNSSDELFTWSCDENIGTITSSGAFTATVSALASNTGSIYVEYNNSKVTIPVTVGANIVEFSDTHGHWAKEYIGTLAGMNMLSGVGDNMFMPENPLTRAEFVAMLAKMTAGADINAAANAGFTDVPESEWYFAYVNWGYENGIVNGMGDGTFAPTKSITREEMAVMLCNYAVSTSFALPQIKEGVSFTDAANISSWAVDYVYTCVGAGVLTGYDTGDFQPQTTATRAQAATVIYKMCGIQGII